MIPANNPRTVLCAPRILSPSRKFLPPSSGVPPPRRRGAAFATYDGPMNNNASRNIPRLDRLEFDLLSTRHSYEPNATRLPISFSLFSQVLWDLKPLCHLAS